MEEAKIFKSREKLTTSGSLLSFRECPNKCVDGYYFDPYAHKKIKCVYCEEKRKELAKNNLDAFDSATEKNIQEVLNLPEYFNGLNFDANSLIVKKDLKLLDEKSVEFVKEQLTELVNNASIGIMPEYSIMINMGKRIHLNNFVYPLIMRYYMSGISVAPFLTSYDLVRLRKDPDLIFDEYNVCFNDLLKKDCSVVFIDVGSDFETINIAKGYMELRALRNKATIFITGSWNTTISNMLSEEEKLKNLAYLISISYNKNEEININTKKPQSRNIKTSNVSELSEEEFDFLVGKH